MMKAASAMPGFEPAKLTAKRSCLVEVIVLPEKQVFWSYGPGGS